MNLATEAPHTFVRGRNIRVTEWLLRAKLAIAKGEMSLRTAAEQIAIAQSLGASQREIANGVGKSAAWVNRLLQWRQGGYNDETPFGPQSKASRQRADRGQAAERADQSDRQREAAAQQEAERLRAEANKAAAERAKAEAEKAKADAARAQAEAAKATADAAQAQAEAAKAKADAERAKARAKKRFKRDARPSGTHSAHQFAQKDRDKLIKCLGMLGSNHAGERDNAATAVEKLRTGLRLMWEDLIIPATGGS